MTEYDRLEARVRERLDSDLIITVQGEGAVMVRWWRSYGDVISDERVIDAPSIVDGLLGVLEYEDAADAQDTRDLRTELGADR